jgi:simple sugar transport system permease protein
MPVANVLVAENLSEVARIIISNGIILYALTRREAGGDVRDGTAKKYTSGYGNKA